MIGNPVEGLFKAFSVVVILVFLLAVGIGVFIGKGIWDDNGYIESKTKIAPMVKLTIDGKKVDTLYIYKIK
jgi:hypothetical protein